MTSHHNQTRSGVLVRYGITDEIARFTDSDPTTEPGRVVAATRGSVLAQTAQGETWCTIGGSAWAEIELSGRYPCAGDWIVLRRYADNSGAALEHILPRKSSLERHAAGKETKSQALAANVDYVFIVMGLDGNFNAHRMERFVTVAWSAGAQPVAVLNKADLVVNPEDYARNIQGVAPRVPVHTVSAHSGSGVAEIRGYLREGVTGVLIGSSGVGKSTILNAIAGAELRATREVRSTDSRGRHTTSLRELFVIDGGGCLIDSPGVREIGLWGDGSMLDDTFSDIADLAEGCKFSDCAHQSEPGCAVKAALESGELAAERYESYLKLKKEVEFVEARSDEKLRRERKKRNKDIAQFSRTLQKSRGKGRTKG